MLNLIIYKSWHIFKELIEYPEQDYILRSKVVELYDQLTSNCSDTETRNHASDRGLVMYRVDFRIYLCVIHAL